MENLYDLLLKLGPGWAATIIIGLVVGSIVYIISHRQYLRQMKEGHADQIKLKDETITMLEQAKQHVTTTLESAKNDITKERDVYRDKLHEEKAHHQSTLLRLTELESRPDLGQILKLEREFHEQKMQVQSKMLSTIERLDAKIDREHMTNAALTQKTAAALNVLVDFLEKKGIVPENHIT